VRVSNDDAMEAQRLAVRTQVVEAQLWAAEHPDELLAIVTSAETGAEALKHLTDAPYAFTEFQAQHILDTLFRRLTRENVAVLRDGLERLRRGDMTQIDWRP
jgi:DNA gyrase/topoisomerase IV subunit A